MRRLLIVGAGGHGRSVAEAALAAGGYEVVGFVDDARPGLEQVWNVGVLGNTADVSSYRFDADFGSQAQLFGSILGLDEQRRSANAELAGVPGSYRTAFRHKLQVNFIQGNRYTPGDCFGISVVINSNIKQGISGCKIFR